MRQKKFEEEKIEKKQESEENSLTEIRKLYKEALSQLKHQELELAAENLKQVIFAKKTSYSFKALCLLADIYLQCVSLK